MTIQSIPNMITILHLNPVLLGHRLHTRNHPAHRRRAKFRLVMLHFIVAPSLRQGGVELEGTPANVEGQVRVARLGIIYGGVESTFADVAPGSDAGC